MSTRDKRLIALAIALFIAPHCIVGFMDRQDERRVNEDKHYLECIKPAELPTKTVTQALIKPTPPEPTEEVTLPIPMSGELAEVLVTACEGQSVPLPIAVAVMDKETGGTFNVDAVGVDGHDIGVFQIRKSNHAWLSEETGADPLTPSGNIECGVWMLSYLYDYYDQNWNAALTCYRWGTAYGDDSEYARDVLGKADKWNGAIE